LIREHFRWDPSQYSRASARNLAGQLAKTGIDLAHFHLGGNYTWHNRFPDQSPIVFLHRAEIPCISTVHSVMGLLSGYCGEQRPFWFKMSMFPLAWWGKMQQLRHVEAEIAVSRHDFQKLRRWYWPVRGRFLQIYHSRLQDEGLSDGPDKRRPIILNVGHLAWRKGQAVLAEAFVRIAGRHPDWVLQLVGGDESGTTMSQIRGIAQGSGLAERIQLLGERHDAFELMKQAALYVQPSFWEALGLALQEAMFRGCACVGSRAGGIPELIQHGRTGLLFEPGNVAQLSEALEELMTNESRRIQLGNAAAASLRARAMTCEQMVQRHLELYSRVIGQWRADRQ
jgi:glycosyltransferase involved in cell wall biosynthesis